MAVPSTAIGPSLRGTLGKYVPTWLGNVPGLRNLYSLVWTIALLGDTLREIAWEGQLAAYPGVGTQDALPYMGASRGLLQGPLETNAHFVGRLIAWLSAVAEMGQPRGLCLQVQNYLVSQGSLGTGIYPVVVFVDRQGNVTTANADQTITETSLGQDFNWDETGNDPVLGGWVDNVGLKGMAVVPGYWSDGWLIIQDPYTHYTGFSDANWLAAWNSGDQTVDSLCPQEVVTGVQSLVELWKGAHCYVRCIVWTPDPATFVISGPTGAWGNWSANNDPTFGPQGEQVAQRDGGNSYWQPEQGA